MQHTRMRSLRPRYVNIVQNAPISEMKFEVRNGIKLGEGDGTVSLLSLGAMCAEGWKRPRWNPARIKITTIEVMSIVVINVPRCNLL
jgi:hypothetical protein